MPAEAISMEVISVEIRTMAAVTITNNCMCELVSRSDLELGGGVLHDLSDMTCSCL